MATCSPTAPYVGMPCLFQEAGVIYQATVTAVVSGTIVDLSVINLGNRTSVHHSDCATNNRWGCDGETCTGPGANWTSGSDMRIKQPV